MQIARSKIQYLPTTLLVVVGVFVWVLSSSGVATAGYTDSAHGNATYGVNRSNVVEDPDHPDAYDIGACTHCHDTFDPTICVNDVNGLMMFAPNNPTSQTDSFCFKCHCNPVSSEQSGMIENKDYGSTFGGGAANSTNIKNAFAFGPPVGNPGSSHNLQLLREWVRTKAAGDWITDNTNACVVCHHPHYSQKNHNPYPDSPPYKTAIRRPQAPSSGVNEPWNIWGDEAGSGELMGLWSDGEYTNLYQAPVYYPWAEEKNLYEPANDTTSDGPNLPNFVTFCRACHGVQVPAVYHDSPLADGRNLTAIDWTQQSGDDHGKGTGTGTGFGVNKWPYSQEDKSYNYVLACTDCHEPHGSPNPFLLRTSVNGTDNITVTADQDGELYMYYFCAACHSPDQVGHLGVQAPNLNCTENGVCHLHGKTEMF